METRVGHITLLGAAPAVDYSPKIKTVNVSCVCNCLNCVACHIYSNVANDVLYSKNTGWPGNNQSWCARGGATATNINGALETSTTGLRVQRRASSAGIVESLKIEVAVLTVLGDKWQQRDSVKYVTILK